MHYYPISMSNLFSTRWPSISPMPANEVDLSGYRVAGFNRAAGPLKEALWLVARLLLFQLCPFSLSALKRAVLRAFGARIGKGVVIKPEVKITFPWKLALGDYVWLGEQCYLLNLEQ